VQTARNKFRLPSTPRFAAILCRRPALCEGWNDNSDPLQITTTSIQHSNLTHSQAIIMFNGVLTDITYLLTCHIIAVISTTVPMLLTWKANSDDPRSLLVRNALLFVLTTYWCSVFIQDNCWKKNKKHQYNFFKSL